MCVGGGCPLQICMQCCVDFYVTVMPALTNVYAHISLFYRTANIDQYLLLKR